MMGRLEVISTRPEPAFFTYVTRSVYGGFAATVLLICVASVLAFQGIEHIHTEATNSLRSIPAHGLTHTNVDQLIVRQSKLLLTRMELLLGACGLCAIVCGAFTAWTVHSALRRIEQQSNELNLLSWRISQEHEVVARRFSHEIHDEFGQMLTGMRMLLQKTSTDDFEEHRKECLTLLEEALSNVRELSQLLRPVILDDFGLDEALQGMVRRVETQSGIRILYGSNMSKRLPEMLETQLFRIAQESLTNLVRHSKATQAEIELFANEDWVTLHITDNGVGFPEIEAQDSAQRGLGLAGMKARIRHMDGTMTAENLPAGGANLFFSVPIHATTAMPLFEHLR
ncbi:MAG: ATP-binding protein [Acidobacteriaceae bacterium]|nr:ATP-binding protein [Acidobacteriaceae bacterium]